MISQKSNPNIPLFNGLRGGLAIWVLLSHIIQLTNAPQNILSKGGIAVDLFMLVSGFLMIWNISTRETTEPSTDKKTWALFFIRRFFRIAPLYYVSLIFAFTLSDYYSAAHGTSYLNIRHTLDRPFLSCKPNIIQDIIYHATFIFGIFPCSSSTNVLPDWSLSLEMQFYIVFPILYTLFKKQSSYILVVIISIIVSYIFQINTQLFSINDAKLLSYPQPSILPLRINCFVAGMVLGKIIKSTAINKIDLSLLILTLTASQRLTFSLIAAAVSAYLIYDRFYSSKHSSLFVWKITNSLVNNKLFNLLGELSYGIYLTHFLILLPAINYLYANNMLNNENGWIRFFVATSMLAAPIMITSLAANKIIEKPMINFGNKIARRIKK